MKKITAYIIVIAMITAAYICSGAAGTICGTPVEAAGAIDISLTNETGRPGDTVEVKINITNNPGMNTLKLKIGYDSHDLTLLSAENSGVLKNMQYLGSQTIDKNPYVMVWANAGNINENGTAGVLKFKINDGAYSGDTALKLECDFCTNQDIQNVGTSLSDGKITINGGAARPEAPADSSSPQDGQNGQNGQNTSGTQEPASSQKSPVKTAVWIILAAIAAAVIVAAVVIFVRRKSNIRKK